MDSGTIESFSTGEERLTTEIINECYPSALVCSQIDYHALANKIGKFLKSWKNNNNKDEKDVPYETNDGPG